MTDNIVSGTTAVPDGKPNPAYDALVRLNDLVDQIHEFQSTHADLVKDSPRLQEYWEAGMRVSSAILMLKEAARQIQQGMRDDT